MNDKPFLDSNILIYVFVDEVDPRTAIAETLLFDGGVISVQVLNEFVSVSRRKQRRAWNEIHQTLAVLRALLDPPSPLTVEIHEKAIALSERYGFDLFDSMIVASALHSSCTILYTEDLHDGQQIEGLAIRNPFKS